MALHPQPATKPLIESAKAKICTIKLWCFYQPPSKRVGRLVNRFINPGEKINPAVLTYMLLLNIYAIGTWQIDLCLLLCADWCHCFPIYLGIRDPEHLSALYSNISFILLALVKHLLDSW